MYALVDRPKDRLIDGSRFLLWAMRAWSISANQNRCPTVTLAPSFARMGAREVLNDFHEMMLACHASTTRTFGFGGIDQDRITEDEALLLSLCSDVVIDNIERVRAVLALRIQKQKVGLIVARLVRIAAYLSTLGLGPTGLARDIKDPEASRRAA